MTVCFISYQFLSKSSKETIQIPLKNILSHTYIHIHKISEASFRGISSLVSKERREGENGETKVKEFREQERRCFERAVDATLENRVPGPSLSRSSRLPIVAREPRAKIIEGRGWEGGRRRRLQSLHDKSVSRIHPRRTAARNDRAKWRRIVFADREREREREFYVLLFTVAGSDSCRSPLFLPLVISNQRVCSKSRMLLNGWSVGINRRRVMFLFSYEIEYLSRNFKITVKINFYLWIIYFVVFTDLINENFGLYEI